MTSLLTIFLLSKIVLNLSQSVLCVCVCVGGGASFTYYFMLEPFLMSALCVSINLIKLRMSISMYIMCAILCLFCDLGRREGALLTNFHYCY